MVDTDPRIAVIGLGAIGTALTASLNDDAGPLNVGAALVRTPPGAGARDDLEYFSAVSGLMAWRPDLVIECAGHEAVGTVVPEILAAGVDVIAASVGALADPHCHSLLEKSARKGGAHLTAISGAIGGIDALRAARHAGLSAVTYTGRKPPRAWRGTPAEEQHDLEALRDPTTIFEGTAADAARLYPKNANVTAAVALAGVGPDATQVRLVADPALGVNVHELEAEGAFGRFAIRIENEALPDNPRSSWLAALSLEEAVRNHFRTMKS